MSLRARHIVEGYVAGRHRSAASGFSIEFAEHRDYVPGDDLRYVDWKLYGRTDKLYLKQYEDETSLTCYLLLDMSKSMNYGERGPGLSKLEYAKCVAASLSWLVLHRTDSVGLLMFDRQIRHVITPSSGAFQLSQILQELERSDAGHESAIADCLHEAAARLTRRGVVILLSDMFDDLNKVMIGLRRLRHDRHDVVLLHILDQNELRFPFKNTTLFRGMESELPITTDPLSIRQAYLQEFGRFRGRLEQGCAQHQIQYSLTPTDQALDETLSSILVRDRRNAPPRVR